MIAGKMQSVPPKAAGVVTTNSKADVPPPQGRLQLVQANQAPTQLTRHGCVLQDTALTVLLA